MLTFGKQRGVMNFTIKQLEAFEAVALHQSISAAAKQMHLTPPAISKQIQNLSTQVGLDLFETVGKRVLLTQAGKELLLDIGVYLERTRNLRQKIQQLKFEEPKTLHVSINNTTQRNTFKLLQKFQQQNPMVNFDISVAAWLMQQKQLKKDEFDFYIIGDIDIDKQKFNIDILGSFQFKLVASANHPLAGALITKAVLQKQRFITGNNPSSSQAFQNQLFKQWKLEKPPMMTESYGSVNEAVQAGIGIALLPDVIVEQQVKEGELVYLDFPFKNKKFNMFLVSKKSKQDPELFIAFRKFIQQHWVKGFSG